MATLTQYVLGFLIFAHGYVHFIYVASSLQWLGSGEEWGWNDKSWILSRFLDRGRVLNLASASFLLAALGFVAGAIGYVLALDWWVPVLTGSALLSSILYVLMWDGEGTGLFEKGGLGILINISILVWIYVLP